MDSLGDALMAITTPLTLSTKEWVYCQTPIFWNLN